MPLTPRIPPFLAGVLVANSVPHPGTAVFSVWMVASEALLQVNTPAVR
ncbi:hypothetical protein OCAE111667_15645 [Occultella aeris]|uniref:Uncharacterized protein n=1 Tax=Occultella aeris TaxID=2761496 RepID=A0A7M4DMV0_9MICO|nr:hypothetical protein [Occultella aeris]VZO38745.1 hypothetical protein HALOF300_03478 [Occultella aeris]